MRTLLRKLVCWALDLPVHQFHPTAWVRPGAVVGAGTWVGPHCIVDAGVRIGRDCDLAAGCQVYSHSTQARCTRGAPQAHTPTILGNNAFVGAGAIVLRGCVVGDRATIGAGAVVREFTVIGNEETWCGVPARRVGP